VFIVCICNTTVFKLIPLLCTHVYSYMFSTMHPSRAYAKNGCGEEPYGLFVQMKREGFKPDAITYISILKCMCKRKGFGVGEGGSWLCPGSMIGV
jgi:pentatricopeptide repeat protein